MTVAEMLRRMSGREFTEWMAADNLDAEDRKRVELGRDAGDGLAQRQAATKRRR